MTHDTPSSFAAKARFWDRRARKYAAASISDPGGYEATLQRVQALLSPHDSVREVGCGTGTTALRLAAGTRQYHATDVSGEMIAIAREKLAALHPPLPHLRFDVADAEAAAPEGPGHDAVLAFNVMHLLPDLDGALVSIKALLKPGGLFMSKTPCLAEMNPIVPRVLVPLMCALGLAPTVLVFDAARLQSTIERHGFMVEAVERHGTKRTDSRVFLLARKPPAADRQADPRAMPYSAMPSGHHTSETG